MAKAPKCKICGAAHWSTQDHVWGEGERVPSSRAELARAVAEKVGAGSIVTGSGPTPTASEWPDPLLRRFGTGSPAPVGSAAPEARAADAPGASGEIVTVEVASKRALRRVTKALERKVKVSLGPVVAAAADVVKRLSEKDILETAKALQDVAAHGLGSVIVKPDGNVEHVPLEDLQKRGKGRPKKGETLSAADRQKLYRARKKGEV